MHKCETDVDCETLMAEGIYVDRHATLESAMPMFGQYDTQKLPVVGYDEDRKIQVLLGVLHEVDALRAFNQALVETAREEHS
jgi:CIC family chloride channel protein